MNNPSNQLIMSTLERPLTVSSLTLGGAPYHLMLTNFIGLTLIRLIKFLLSRFNVFLCSIHHIHSFINECLDIFEILIILDISINPHG